MRNFYYTYKSILRHLIFSIIIIGFFQSFYDCSGCSQSGIRNAKNKRSNKTPIVTKKVNANHSNNETLNRKNHHEKIIINMIKENGVYKIPVEINGVEMSFILDTGASLISISAMEAGFLYKQGKLKDEDFIGTANFIDANGDITEGTVILLRTIKIGNRSLSNIKASVVHNLSAPLLFGQSALGEFGKISIDYNKNQIIFE